MSQPWDVFDGQRFGWSLVYKGVRELCRGVKLARPILNNFIASFPNDVVSAADKATLTAFLNSVDAACDIITTIERIITQVE